MDKFDCYLFCDPQPSPPIVSLSHTGNTNPGILYLASLPLANQFGTQCSGRHIYHNIAEVGRNTSYADAASHICMDCISTFAFIYFFNISVRDPNSYLTSYRRMFDGAMIGDLSERNTVRACPIFFSGAP